MKRIIIVDEDTGCAGATVSLVYIVRRFVREGYDVIVYTQKPPELLSMYHDIGARTHRYKFAAFSNLCINLYASAGRPVVKVNEFTGMLKDAVKFIFGTAYFFTMFRSAKPDFVYVNEYVMLQALVAAWLLHVPCGVHIRSNILTGSRGFRRKAASALIGRICEFIIPITSAEGKQLCLPPRLEKKIRVVGEFLDEQNFNARDNQMLEKNGWRLDRTKKRVVMLGGLATIKGTIEYLNAARFILSVRRDIQFIVAGKPDPVEPEYCARCMELMQSDELRNSVVMIGEIDRVPALIAASDLLVSSNTFSHFSRPVIEAWAAHKPVVSSATTHAKALIEDGVDGLLADVHDPAAFGAAIVRVLDDTSLASELAEHGYAKACSEYNAEKNTAKIADYVRICIERQTKEPQ